MHDADNLNSQKRKRRFKEYLAEARLRLVALQKRRFHTIADFRQMVAMAKLAEQRKRLFKL